MVGNAAFVVCRVLVAILLALVAAFPQVSTANVIVPRTSRASPEDIRVEILRPREGELSDNYLYIVATVDSLYEVERVHATVADRQVLLTPGQYCEEFCYSAWIGTLSLVGLERGEHDLLVEVKDLYGNTASARRPFVYDQKPRLTVVDPPDGAVAQPSIHIKAACTDDDPGGCATLDVYVFGQPVPVASGTENVDLVVSLAAYDGRGTAIGFIARDSASQVTEIWRSVYVEASPNLIAEDTVNGPILDVGTDHILYLSQAAKVVQLMIHNRITGQDTLIMGEAGRYPQYGYLTPKGAIFVEQSGDVLTRKVYEWRDGQLLEVGSPDSVSSLVVSGGYALWSESKTLVRRDLATGENTTISTNAGNIENDVAEDGTVAFWTWPPGSQIFRYRAGVSEQLTSDPDVENVYPRTDGVSVIYRKERPAGGDTERALALYSNGVETLLTPFARRTMWPDWDYSVNEGWVAFTRINAQMYRQVWLRSPEGQEQRVTFFGNDSIINGFGPGGTVMIQNRDRRYLLQTPCSAELQEVGFAQGKVFWLDGEWYEKLGNTLLRVDIKAGPAPILRSCLEQRVWLPVMTNEG